MIKDNKLYYLNKISKSFIYLTIFFCLINFQTSLSYFSLFQTATPNIISIIIYLCIVRLNLTPSNIILFFVGFMHDIMVGGNIGLFSFFLILFKYLTERLILESINKKNQQEWILFTMIFISSFGITFLLNVLINLSIPDLSPIFFHVGITLILFPLVNLSIDIISFVTRLIKS